MTLVELARVNVLAAERRHERSDYVRRAVLQGLKPDPDLVVVETSPEDVLQPAPRRRRPR